MTIEVIDGTLEAATTRSSNAKVSIYDAIVVRSADGSERRLQKIAAAPAVAAMLLPGTQGRFYVYSAIDHKGLVAVRSTDGRSAYAMPSGNERIMLMAAIVGAAWFVVVLATRGNIAWLSLVLGVAGGFGYFFYRSTRLESRARYDADGPRA